MPATMHLPVLIQEVLEPQVNTALPFSVPWSLPISAEEALTEFRAHLRQDLLENICLGNLGMGVDSLSVRPKGHPVTDGVLWIRQWLLSNKLLIAPPKNPLPMVWSNSPMSSPLRLPVLLGLALLIVLHDRLYPSFSILLFSYAHQRL